MINQSQQLPSEIIQLATNLSTQLGIPLTTNPTDIQFITQCINKILIGLNSAWKPIHFQPRNQKQLTQAWRKIFEIAQSSLLIDDDKLIDENEQIGIENLMMLYQVLMDGSQALKQQNIYEMTNNEERTKKNTKQSQSGQNKQNKQVSITPQQIQYRQRQQIRQVKKKQDNTQQISQSKSRPKTAVTKSQKIQKQKLQQQIISAVTKTMAKSYNKKNDPQFRAKIREKEGTQAVQMMNRKLDYALKDYQIDNRLNEKKKIKNSKQNKDLIQNAYMKMIANKHKILNNQLQDQQLGYYLQLRDKKIAYIRHIHKLIEKLEKQRQIDHNKQQREMQNIKKKQMIQKIQQVDNLFKQNMEKLQQNYQQRKKVKDLQSVGEIQVCRAMEKNMKQKKAKEMEDIKNLWRIEQNQLHKITTDEEKMKNKLIQIYRKYRI